MTFGRMVLVTSVGLASLVVAYAAASSTRVLLVGIAGVAVVLPLVLHAPAATLLAWIATGATLGGWLDMSLGGPLPTISPDRILFVALVGICAIRWVHRPSTMLPPGRIEIMMLLFLVVSAVSNLVAGPSLEVNGDGGGKLDFIFLTQSYAVPFLGFFLAKNLLREERHLRALLVTCVAVGCFVGAVGILQHFTGITMFTPTRYETIHESRATGTLSSAPHFGVVVSLCLFPAILLLRRARTLVSRSVLLGAVVLIFVSLILCKTRAAYLGVVVGVGLLGRLDRPLGRVFVVVAFVAVFGLMIAWPVFVDTDFVQGRLSDPTPILNRIALTGTAVNMIVHRPLFGFGFGRYRFAQERTEYFSSLGGVSREWAYSLHVPHNEYLHILVLTGLAGFLPYLAVIVACLKTSMRAIQSRGGGGGIERDLAMTAFVGFVAYLVNGFFSELLFAWYGSNMIYVLLGAVDGNRMRIERDAPGASVGEPSGETA